MNENNELKNLGESEESENEMVILKPKVKKVLTEKQIEAGRKNCEEGRKKLAEKKKQQKEEANKRKDELILLKAEKLKNDKLKLDKKIKQNLNLPDDIDIEEIEKVIKKPKRKIIYKEESDSDSEEEITIVKKKKEKLKPVNELIKPKAQPIFW